MDTYSHLFYINAVHRENHRDAYVAHMLGSGREARPGRIVSMIEVARMKAGKMMMAAGAAILPLSAAGSVTASGSDAERTGAVAAGSGSK